MLNPTFLSLSLFNILISFTFKDWNSYQ